MSGNMLIIPREELEYERHLPSFQTSPDTRMTGYKWNRVRVTLREASSSSSVLTRELRALSGLSHPQLLLVMGHTEDLAIVFEPVLLGSLYQCLHNLGSVQISVIDVSLQVVDALLYLSERGLVHSSVSSHAVLMVNSTQAKLGMFERMVEEGEDLSPPPDILYPWTSPEILMGHYVALAEGDVYSLCCLLWEMVKMKAPWVRHRLQDIPVLVARGYTLKLDKETMPMLLFRVMREGLIWNVDKRDLELGEVRDMLLMERDIQEQRMEAAAGIVQDRVDEASARNSAVKLPPLKKDSKPKVERSKSSALRRFSNTAIQSDIVKYVKQRDEDVFEDDNYSGVDLPSVSEGQIEDDLESSLCSVEIFEGPQNPRTSGPKSQQSSAKGKNPSSFLSKYKQLRGNGSQTLNRRKSPENFLSKYPGQAFRRPFPTAANNHVRASFLPTNVDRPRDGATKQRHIAEASKEIQEKSEDKENTSQDRFESAKSFFEESCVTEQRSLNVSSGELYRTALSSPANLKSLPERNTNVQSKEVRGTYINYWRKQSNDDVVKKTTVSSTVDTVIDNKPQLGSVKDAVKFYQGLEEEGNVNVTLYQSAQEESPKSIAGGCVNKSVQTEPEKVPQGGRFLAESTPISTTQQRMIQTPPIMSPLYASPLFQNRRRSAMNLNEQRRSVIEESLSSPMVDFGNPDGRQKMFTTALSQAQILSPASLTSREAVSSPYQTCLEDSDVINNNLDTSPDLDQSYQKRQAVVTFNSSVEEITTSIVSLATDNSHILSHTSVEDNFDTVQDTEDGYFDDDLNSDQPSEPVNIQLLTRGQEDDIENIASHGWKVGDRVSAQLSTDEGWYPANITMFADDEAVVTFEHNLELKSVPLNKIMEINDGVEGAGTVLSEYETGQDLQMPNEEGDGLANKEEPASEDQNDTEEEEQEQDEDVMNNNISNEDIDQDEESDGDAFKTGVEDRVWSEGEECVALWTEDGLWYKAVIDGIEGNTAVVTFTEYGNSAYCDLDNLREPETVIGEDGQLVENKTEEDEWS